MLIFRESTYHSVEHYPSTETTFTMSYVFDNYVHPETVSTKLLLLKAVPFTKIGYTVANILNIIRNSVCSLYLIDNT